MRRTHVAGGVNIGNHGAVAGDGHSGQQHADALEHRIKGQRQHDGQRQQRHGKHAQHADAIQARIAQRGEDIAVRHGRADDHHGHRRVHGADGSHGLFDHSREMQTRRATDKTHGCSDDAGVEHCLEIDLLAAGDEQHAIGEEEQIEDEDEHRQARHAVHTVDGLDDGNAHEADVGEDEHQLIPSALLLLGGDDAYQHAGKQHLKDVEDDGNAHGADHHGRRGIAFQHGGKNGERRYGG